MSSKKTILSFVLCLLVSITANAQTQLNAAGATFPHAIYSKWFFEYAKKNPNVRFNYQAIGSGGGIRQLLKQTVDFGASDAPMKKKSMKKAPWKIDHIPTVLGAVSVMYNHKGIKNGLKLDGPTLAKIFLGDITKWNDQEIAKLNPGMSLPADDILVVRRADGSGTTAIFSDFLSKIHAPWKKKVGKGKALRWPTGIGAKGSDGVTAMVTQNEASISYVDLAHALKNKVKTVSLKNGAGEYIQPSSKSISLAANSVDASKGDFTVSIVNSKAKGSYPLSAFTYILLPHNKENNKLVEARKFLKWALTDGQQYAAKLYYAPLPDAVRKAVVKKL